MNKIQGPFKKIKYLVVFFNYEQFQNMYNKIVAIIVVLFAFSCADKKPESKGMDGANIYKINCVVCHGNDGKLGVNGSKDLTKSALTLEERKTIIKNGKGAMIGLGTILNGDEIKAVAEYTFKLK